MNMRKKRYKKYWHSDGKRTWRSSFVVTWTEPINQIGLGVYAWAEKWLCAIKEHNPDLVIASN
jgi:hypothetical protein